MNEADVTNSPPSHPFYDDSGAAILEAHGLKWKDEHLWCEDCSFHIDLNQLSTMVPVDVVITRHAKQTNDKGDAPTCALKRSPITDEVSRRSEENRQRCFTGGRLLSDIAEIANPSIQPPCVPGMLDTQLEEETRANVEGAVATNPPVSKQLSDEGQSVTEKEGEPEELAENAGTDGGRDEAVADAAGTDEPEPDHLQLLREYMEVNLQNNEVLHVEPDAGGASGVIVAVGRTDGELAVDGARLLKSQLLCKGCLAQLVKIVFLPCGHLVFCDNCAARTTQCPECHGQVIGIVTAYIGPRT